MEKIRVPKGEKYWMVLIWWSHFYVDEVVDLHCASDNDNWNQGNYFNAKEEAEVMANKLHAVLKGADVIELPSEEEIVAESKKYEYPPLFKAAMNWLKSKIVK